MTDVPRKIDAIVVGGSAGGLDAVGTILGALPPGFSIPILVVLHVAPSQPSYLAELLGDRGPLSVCEAQDKQPIVPSTVYIAPPDYHLLVEKQLCLALSVDELVLFSRPSIDVLFESAADAYGAGVVGVLLTGANSDGTRGLRRIRAAGGFAIVQDPATAESPEMPAAAVKDGALDKVLGLDDIAAELLRMAPRPKGSAS